MGELVIGIAFLILSIIILIQSASLPEVSYEPLGPSTFPKFLAIGMGVLALVLIIKNVKKMMAEKDKEKVTFKDWIDKNLPNYNKVLITLGTFSGYALLMNVIGFRISTFLFLISTQWFVSDKEKKYIPITLGIAIFISLGSYYFFQNYLGVIFPTGILFE